MVEGGCAFINVNVVVGGNLVDSGPSQFELTGNIFSRVTWEGSPSNALDLAAGSQAQFLAVDINNANGFAVAATGGCVVNSGDLGGAGNVAGGLSLQNITSCIADNDGFGGSATTVTGPGGDVLVGAVPQTYLGLALTPGYTEATNPADATTCTLNRFAISQ